MHRVSIISSYRNIEPYGETICFKMVDISQYIVVSSNLDIGQYRIDIEISLYRTALPSGRCRVTALPNSILLYGTVVAAVEGVHSSNTADCSLRPVLVLLDGGDQVMCRWKITFVVLLFYCLQYYLVQPRVPQEHQRINVRSNALKRLHIGHVLHSLMSLIHVTSVSPSLSIFTRFPCVCGSSFPPPPEQRL